MWSTEMKKHLKHTSIFVLQFSVFWHSWKMQVWLYISYKSASSDCQNEGDNLFISSLQGNQSKCYILHAISASQNFEAKVLAPGQNLSLLLGRGMGSSFIPAENVNNSRITGEWEKKALDTSEKKESYGYLQNAWQKWVSVGYFEPGWKRPLTRNQ